MKKRYLSVAVVMLLTGSIFFSSCIGSFSLTNKLLSWNRQVGNKFVNELVFFAFWVLPVYEVSSLADVLVLNSIEFWSGDNPVASSTKTIEGENGDMYLVECDGKGYTITNQTDGSAVRFDFDAQEQTWSITVDNETYELMTFVDDNHVKMPTADGSYTTVELSQAGVMAYEELVTNGILQARAN